MSDLPAAAEAITKAGPVGWVLLILLIASIAILTGVIIAGLRTGMGVLRSIQHESQQGTKRALDLIGQVKDSVGELRNENNRQFAEVNQRFADELGNVRERLGRLEGVAGLMPTPFVGGGKRRAQAEE